MIPRLAFRNLFRNIRRTLAVLLTVSLGAGALFAFKGFIHGMLSDYKESTIHAHYGHGQINTKGYRETVYQEPWKQWIDNPEVMNFLKNQEEVEFVFPRVNFFALLSNGSVTVSGSGQGIDAANENKFFHCLNIVQGNPLVEQERGIVIGCGLAKALKLKPGDRVTLMVKAIDGSMSKRVYLLTGIFETGSQDFDSKFFHIQLPEAKDLLKTEAIEFFSLGLKEEGNWEHLVENLIKQFPELEATPFHVLDKIYYQHSVDWLNAQFRVVQVIIIGIVLLGIFNTISTSILERKQEIGNLRANGESVMNIMQLILSEGALLGVFGSLFGIAAAYIFILIFLNHGIMMPPGPGLTKEIFISFKFEWEMLVPTLMLSIISALIASAFAGIKVAKMPIAVALRSH